MSQYLLDTNILLRVADISNEYGELSDDEYQELLTYEEQVVV